MSRSCSAVRNAACTASAKASEHSPDTVYVEIEPGGLCPERQIDLARYRLVSGRLTELALDERRSVALIGRLARQL